MITETYKQMLASLVAAVSLLENGGKKAAASDKMFDQMLADYRKAIEAGRADWAALEQTKSTINDMFDCLSMDERIEPNSGYHQELYQLVQKL